MGRKFGAPGNPLEVAGDKVGIKFNTGRKIYETMEAHRVVEWCKRTAPQKHDALMEVMFRRYFTDAADITQRDVLLGIVEEVGGLDRQGCENLLNGKDLEQEVKVGAREAQQMGVSGVPFFIVEPSASKASSGKKAVSFSGAQPADAISEVLQKLS
eukprot:gb/GFBE01038614.1/.p1 GENE.gb/GFBE01038614.1/~~gb/GFBE01038614.1/.p1  ORF type:complete len:156 (+),score=46.60 gb/GFBE01038614.1/:1-468(+)